MSAGRIVPVCTPTKQNMSVSIFPIMPTSYVFFFSYFFSSFTVASHHLLKGGGNPKPVTLSWVPSSPLRQILFIAVHLVLLDITNAVTLLRTVSFLP